MPGRTAEKIGRAAGFAGDGERRELFPRARIPGRSLSKESGPGRVRRVFRMVVSIMDILKLVSPGGEAGLP